MKIIGWVFGNYVRGCAENLRNLIEPLKLWSIVGGCRKVDGTHPPQSILLYFLLKWSPGPISETLTFKTHRQGVRSRLYCHVNMPGIFLTYRAKIPPIHFLSERWDSNETEESKKTPYVTFDAHSRIICFMCWGLAPCHRRLIFKARNIKHLWMVEPRWWEVQWEEISMKHTLYHSVWQRLWYCFITSGTLSSPVYSWVDILASIKE